MGELSSPDEIYAGFKEARKALTPEVCRLWSKYRTCSKVGNSGRNIAWDRRNEFMNLSLDVKEIHPDSPSRID